MYVLEPETVSVPIVFGQIETVEVDKDPTATNVMFTEALAGQNWESVRFRLTTLEPGVREVIVFVFKLDPFDHV